MIYKYPDRHKLVTQQQKCYDVAIQSRWLCCFASSRKYKTVMGQVHNVLWQANSGALTVIIDWFILLCVLRTASETSHNSHGRERERGKEQMTHVYMVASGREEGGREREREKRCKLITETSWKSRAWERRKVKVKHFLKLWLLFYLSWRVYPPPQTPIVISTATTCDIPPPPPPLPSLLVLILSRHSLLS